MLALVIIPVSTTEIPHQASAENKVLATAVATPKPVAVKPVAKKPVVKKKAPVKKKTVKKERLIAAPPLITVETAPHSGR